MVKDRTNRGGRRPCSGEKPQAALEKIQNGKMVKVISNDIPTLTPDELDVVDLSEGAVMEGVLMTKPSDYLSSKQKNGLLLGADEIYEEIWL